MQTVEVVQKMEEILTGLESENTKQKFQSLEALSERLKRKPSMHDVSVSVIPFIFSSVEQTSEGFPFVLLNRKIQE